MTKDEVLKLALEALNRNDYLGWQTNIHVREAIREALAQPEQEPAALVEKFSLLLWDYQELERAFEKATGGKWIRKSNTPQSEPVIDKSAAVRIATALGWEPKRTWVGLTDEDNLDWEEGDSLKDLVKAIESKLKEKNDCREWQDLTDDEMLMIYGQNHEGKKYNLGRMVQQALKEKNT